MNCLRNTAISEAQPTAATSSSPQGRDLRLDLFRGLANWAIFLDHIPNNVFAWLTTRNYGFSDAAEIFVYISGFTAAFVYGRRMRNLGFVFGSALLFRRVWQLYVAHVLLFVFYAASIGYVAQRYGHSHLLDEFNVAGLIDKPVATLTQGLLLKFKPLNLDVLPLYIVLMAGFPPLLWAMIRAPNGALAASLAVYVLARQFGWNFSAYPSGGWYFNPFAWQFLFAFGAWAALGGAAATAAARRHPAALVACAAFLVFAAAITLAGRLESAAAVLPPQLLAIFEPNDKTNLAPYRILHVIALATVVLRLLPKDWKWLRSMALRPAIVCGQRSLEVFCVGIFLSFVGHCVLEIYSNVITQIAASLGGIALLTLVATYRTWSKRLDQRSAPARLDERGRKPMETEMEYAR